MSQGEGMSKYALGVMLKAKAGNVVIVAREP